MYAFHENNNIYITSDISVIPSTSLYIEVEDTITIGDIFFDGHVLRLKTEAEKEADRIAQEREEAKRQLAESDSKMVRVVEDVIDVLVNKSVIKKDDLPQVVIEKLNYRKELRSKINENIK